MYGIATKQAKKKVENMNLEKVKEMVEAAISNPKAADLNKDGKLSDVKSFNISDGLSWHMNGGRQRTEMELSTWIGKRASAGRMPPTGFPRPPKFN